jgi:hypothetical protein
MRGKPNRRISFAHWWIEQNSRVRFIVMALFVLAIVLCGVGILIAGMSLMPDSTPSDTPTPTLEPTTVAPTTPTAPASTPEPTDTPGPTETPTIPPTETPTLEPTPEPTSTPTPTPPPDPQGDVGVYGSGEPVEDPPAGLDIRAASPDSDLRVALQPGEGAPSELAEWVAEGEILLWIALHEPIPDPPTQYTEWLFALDLDGDLETGRPPGVARINPDLGMEAAIGVYYNPSSEGYMAYLLVWDPEQGGLTPQVGSVRFTLDESRTLLGLAMPLETLTQTVAQIADVTVAPEAVKGRAAALSDVAGLRVIDFYPDRPD